MQPLDVEDFQDNRTLQPQHDYLEQEKKHWFSYHDGPTRKKSFKREIIKQVFADRGIFPFDPSRLIQPLQDEMSYHRVHHESE